MAYKGYLLKIGDWEFPLKYIRAETYVALRSGQDLDSYRDADGNLHRTALDNFLYKIEFETPPMMTDADYEYIWSQLQSRYINSVQKKVQIECYIPEIHGYAKQNAYIPDVSQTVYRVGEGKVYYNQTRFAFIGYGKN